MTSWKRPGSINNNKLPSPGLGCELHEMAFNQRRLSHRLGDYFLAKLDPSLEPDFWNSGIGRGIQRIRVERLEETWSSPWLLLGRN